MRRPLQARPVTSFSFPPSPILDPTFSRRYQAALPPTQPPSGPSSPEREGEELAVVSALAAQNETLTAEKQALTARLQNLTSEMEGQMSLLAAQNETLAAEK